MPIRPYGVLKGSIIDRRLGSGGNPHYQVHVVDEETHWRLAINVESQLQPSEVAYYVADPFAHPIVDRIKDLKPGFHELESKPDSGALDFIRGNLIRDFREMVPLPANLSGPDNDLNEKLDGYVQRAMADEDAAIYAFGQRWGPENKNDKIFGFSPGNGVHDIHMNQGNSGSFKKDNGVYQDGGLIFHFPARDQWIAIFLRFQSQDIHTDDRTGDPRAEAGGGPPSEHEPTGNHPGTGELPTHHDPDGLIRIMAALVNDTKTPERETVTLLNTGVENVDLTGWMLADKQKNKFKLDGSIAAGATREIVVQAPMSLSNKGGIISLLRADGIKVHGVSYTRDQARNPGWTITF
jgi:uncharacterized protein YukJ